MEAVEDRLLRRLKHARPRGLNVGLPHVHRHRLDAIKLLRCQSRVVPVETVLRAVFGDVLHRALIQVADQRQVRVPLGRGLLVDADPANDLRRFALPPPRDGARHNAPGLIPADPQDLRGSRHVALPPHIDGEALEEQRKSRPPLRPWHRDLDHSVFPAGHPWDPRMQVGLELAAVEMAPGPLLGVIVQRQRLGAVRARPHRVLRVLGPHIHSLPGDVQLDAAHGPRRLQAQQVLIQRGVLHGGLLMRSASYPVRLPMRNPDAPTFLGWRICQDLCADSQRR